MNIESCTVALYTNTMETSKGHSTRASMSVVATEANWFHVWHWTTLLNYYRLAWHSYTHAHWTLLLNYHSFTWHSHAHPHPHWTLLFNNDSLSWHSHAHHSHWSLLLNNDSLSRHAHTHTHAHRSDLLDHNWTRLYINLLRLLINNLLLRILPLRILSL